MLMKPKGEADNFGVSKDIGQDDFTIFWNGRGGSKVDI